MVGASAHYDIAAQLKSGRDVSSPSHTVSVYTAITMLKIPRYPKNTCCITVTHGFMAFSWLSPKRLTKASCIMNIRLHVDILYLVWQHAESVGLMG